MNTLFGLDTTRNFGCLFGAVTSGEISWIFAFLLMGAVLCVSVVVVFFLMVSSVLRSPAKKEYFSTKIAPEEANRQAEGKGLMAKQEFIEEEKLSKDDDFLKAPVFVAVFGILLILASPFIVVFVSLFFGVLE